MPKKVKGQLKHETPGSGEFYSYRRAIILQANEKLSQCYTIPADYNLFNVAIRRLEIQIDAITSLGVHHMELDRDDQYFLTEQCNNAINQFHELIGNSSVIGGNVRNAILVLKNTQPYLEKDVVKTHSLLVLLKDCYINLIERDKIEDYAARITAHNDLDNEHDSTSLQILENVRGEFSSVAESGKVGQMYMRARLRAEMSKTAAAEATGMQEKSIRRFENGEQNPTLKTLQRYAKSLGYEARIELLPIDKS